MRRENLGKLNIDDLVELVLFYSNQASLESAQNAEQSAKIAEQGAKIAEQGTKIVELSAIIAELRKKVEELEARLNQNSSNSSKPPSSNPWIKPKSLRESSGKKPGGQWGHKGHGLRLDREPDEIIELRPTECEKCGADIFDLPGSWFDTRYKIDLVIRPVIMQYKLHTTLCPNCGANTAAKFPDELTSTKQYGEGVRSIAVLLTQFANVSYDKTRAIFKTVFEIPLSTGTLVKMTKKFADKSSDILKEIADRLKKASTIHNDETGERVCGKIYWLHTASNAEATYNTVSQKRGREGTDENGVLKEFYGTSIHDCWSPYFGYDNCRHALCNAHLLRELNAVIENTGQLWASQMKSLLKEMKRVVDELKSEEKTELTCFYKQKFAEAYAAAIKLGEEENPLEEGVRKRSKPRNLLNRFAKYQEEICRFANDFCVPFDNNQAERDIRNVKVKQKVSGGFRSVTGAKNHAAAISVISTATKQGHDVFQTISGIFSGKLKSLFT